ncbi:hypothetical protein AB0D34_08435 [Streptomyces sp. NPDC048420]|uniref:hypothetical protein n=1 Tax=Streptomyces sp. NPDC048420 TaxID=3155755 RepID=UPI00343C9EE6
MPDWMAHCAECCRMYRGAVAAYELSNLCFTLDVPLTDLRSGLFARHVLQEHRRGVPTEPHLDCALCDQYAFDDSAILLFLRAEHQARALFLPADIEIRG